MKCLGGIEPRGIYIYIYIYIYICVYGYIYIYMCTVAFTYMMLYVIVLVYMLSFPKAGVSISAKSRGPSNRKVIEMLDVSEDAKTREKAGISSISMCAPLM